MASVGQPPAAASADWTCPTCGNVYPRDFALCPRDATPRVEKRTAGDALLGQVMGATYRILRVIGEGGMARLYEAEHMRIGHHVAIKVIHDDLARDSDLLARFEREARAAGRIHSEHVVRLIDVLRTADGRPCLVSELLSGEDLQALLDRKKKLLPYEAIPIARQICRAVAAAHAVGVVHRDLKPSNVFLCENQFVKVLDFGVAKIENDEKLTRTDAVMGTAAYMAPEQARKAADADTLADVYSIGAVMYHMLTGEPPYGNVPAVSRFALVLHEEPARPREIEPSIPAGIEGVIQHAMARDRAARISSPLTLEAQLTAFDKRRTSTQMTARAHAPTAPLTIGEAVEQRESPTEQAIKINETVASEIVVRAKIARPLAAFVAAMSSLASGAWLAILLGLLVQPASSGEHALIGVMAGAMTIAVGLLHIRELRRTWRSATAVMRYIRPTLRALAAGVVVFGALELFAFWSAAVFGAPWLGIGARVIPAGVAAALGLGWQRLGLDERLRRRIG